MVVVENIRKTETAADNECLVADFSLPHPARRYDTSDLRRVPIRVQVTKDGVEGTEIRVNFNRFEVSWLDAIEVLSMARLTSVAVMHRFTGFILPLTPTKYEADLIWDREHDEVASRS